MVLGAGAALALCAAPLRAQESVESFYRGRTIEVYVGATAGGGYDIYARLMARFIGKYVPGNPSLIVRNMPGAGHLRMTNFVYNSAPRDGSVMAIPQQAIAVEQASGASGIQYDARRFIWIGRMLPVVTITFTWHTSPVKTIAQARQREAIMGATGATSPTTFYTKALNEIAGAKFKIVAGYPGSAETQFAIEKGELEGGTADWTSFKTTNAAWVAEKKINILVQWAMRRSYDLPDTPLALELAPNEAERHVLELFAIGNELGRSVLTTPGAPPDRVEALRTAFLAMMEDPELKATAKQQRLELGPALNGEEVQQLIEQTLKASPQSIARARAIRGD